MMRLSILLTIMLVFLIQQKQYYVSGACTTGKISLSPLVPPSGLTKVIIKHEPFDEAIKKLPITVNIITGTTSNLLISGSGAYDNAVIKNGISVSPKIDFKTKSVTYTVVTSDFTNSTTKSSNAISNMISSSSSTICLASTFAIAALSQKSANPASIVAGATCAFFLSSQEVYGQCSDAITITITLPKGLQGFISEQTDNSVSVTTSEIPYTPNLVSAPDAKSFPAEAGENSWIFNHKSTLKLSGAAENFCVGTQGRLWVVAPDNGLSKLIVLQIDSNGILSEIANIYIGNSTGTLSWGDPQSCYYNDGIVGVAVANKIIDLPGRAYFYDETTRNELGFVEVGPLPDMIYATPDKSKWIIGNEAEPSQVAPYNDPFGGFTIIKASDRTKSCTIDFNFGQADSVYLNKKIHRARKDVSVEKDIEPEYIAFDPTDSSTAYITLQEANAIAIVDMDFEGKGCNRKLIKSINALGWKNYNIFANTTIDPSDKDTSATFRNEPVYGMYQPDAMQGFKINGQLYFATANEGDTKDQALYGNTATSGEESRASALTFNSSISWPYSLPFSDTTLGRLVVSKFEGDNDDGTYENVVTFGGRSFSIWKFTPTSTELVFDSGVQTEKRAYDFCVARSLPTNIEATGFYDPKREDNKGTEPESLEVVTMPNGQTLLFLGLERANLIGLWDISDPYNAKFLNFIYDASITDALKSPEGIHIIPASSSPTGKALLVASGEVSLSVAVFEFYEGTQTSLPTKTPTKKPTTKTPTAKPTKNPTKNPTKTPTTKPTTNPTANPTNTPI